MSTTNSCLCEAKVLQSSCRSVGADFSICLPFGGRLYSEQGYIMYEPGVPPPDGEYTSFTLKNGCMTEVGYADISTYTSTPCAPAPVACDVSGSATAPLSPQADNLTQLDSAGRLLTQLIYASGSGISITGSGTATDPLAISCTVSGGDGALYVRAGNTGVYVSGSGSAADPYEFGHAEVLGRTVTANGFMFDKFGHLVSYSAPGSYTHLTAIQGVNGVKSSTDVNTGIATVELEKPLNPSIGTYEFGGYSVELDEYNRIYKITKIVVPEDDTEADDAGADTIVKRVGASGEFSVKLSRAGNFLIQVYFSGTTEPFDISVDNNSIQLDIFTANMAAGTTKKLAVGTHVITTRQSSYVVMTRCVKA